MGPIMSELPLHRHYLHYSELPYSQRVLYTAALLVLGMAYLFALLNLYFTYAGKAGGNPALLTPQDLIVAYSGTGKASRLESALHGPMSTMLPHDEVNIIINWVQSGSRRDAYDRDVRPILDKRCMACHDGSNPHLPNLNGYDNLKKMTEKDSGATIPTLVRVSHIHLFGLTFIFFIIGLMFSHAYVRPVWFKCAIVAVPFGAIVVDVSSWYIIKVFHPFVYVEILAGALMAACFAFMWVVAMYQMWLSSAPLIVAQREQGDLPIIGRNPAVR
jgi:hypothetical protein